MYRYRKTSITDQVRKSITSIAVLLAVPAIIGLVVMLIYASRTQAMTRRMNDVAQMKPALENTIAENLFSVAAGRISFEDSAVDELIVETDDTLDRLLGETQGRGQIQLTIARRTMDTLEQYVLKVREGMRAGEPISKIEGIVDEVRNVGRLITDMLDAFTTEEIANVTETNQRMRLIVSLATITEVVLLLVAFLKTRSETNKITKSIYAAIYNLEETVRRIAEGNFSDRLQGINVEEMKDLSVQINQMADRLESLIERERHNQEHLSKAELRTLQAQINPHFLYNTLDTIVWQAESGKADEVVRLTRNLSNFFRISLSSGADWIPVNQELKHVTAYLSIQKIRYRDILDYDVDQPEGLEEVYMLKLLLQPLVENALYHRSRRK